MFPVGIKHNPPYATCLTAIKNVLPEIRSHDIIGEQRWSLVLSLPEVYEIRNGDLLLWAKQKLYCFHPQHIALVVNTDEKFIYGLAGIINGTTAVSLVPDVITNHYEWIRIFRPKYPVWE